jgi:UDP-glucose 4-epimerase
MKRDDHNSALVTGGAGFIGSHLAEALVERGVQVTIVDDLSNGSLENIRTIAGRVNFYSLDIRSPAFIELLLSGNFKTLFHFAAEAYVPPSVKNPENNYLVNLAGPFYILEALRKAKLDTTLIIGSSAAVYGNPCHIPISELDPTFPISPYGVSKLAIERYTAVYSQIYGLKAASLRLFSIYGPRQRKQIVYDFIHKVDTNPDEMEILGDGTQVRDLIYVKDVVQAVLLIWEHAPLEGEVYNVAAGVGLSTRQVAATVAHVMGVSPALRYTGNIRPGDAEKWVACIDKIIALGFWPRFSFEQGVRQTVEWYHTCHQLAEAGTRNER